MPPLQIRCVTDDPFAGFTTTRETAPPGSLPRMDEPYARWNFWNVFLPFLTSTPSPDS